MRFRPPALAVAGLAAALALVSSAGGAVESGTIVANRGAAGVVLGMTRAQVVAKLGKPLYENANGFMQYAKRNLFDVYLDTTSKRVRLIGVSGPRFCTARRVCMLTRNGIARLRAQYGSALRRFTDETGEIGYELRGRLGGKPVFTTFFPDRPTPSGRIVQIFIGYR